MVTFMINLFELLRFVLYVVYHKICGWFAAIWNLFLASRFFDNSTKTQCTFAELVVTLILNFQWNQK